MRINNNIMAMNTHRQYSINNASISKSTEKLSSGYRINRAGDDAAGLAISEKMRAQIRGLTMASKNSQDAISLVQTAEGALQETHNILQRMRELAVQAASDTNEQSIDRAALQAEFNQLQKEINDIATTTRFNDQNLLDGTFQSKLSSLNTDMTNAAFMSNINNYSVERASAGNYAMEVTVTQQVNTVTTGGVQVTADTTNLSATKFDSVDFSGLMTDKHNGNTYELVVTGDDIENMTFQLKDTNGDIVGTAQNVDVSKWNAASRNLVGFDGLGTFEFKVAAGQQITGAGDVKAFTGQKVSFGSGSVYQSSLTDGVTVAATGTQYDSPSNFSNALTLAATGPTGVTPTQGTLTVEFAGNFTTDAQDTSTYALQYSTNASGELTVALLKDGTSVESKSFSATEMAQLSAASGSVTHTFDGYGTVTFKNTDAVNTLTLPASIAAGSGTTQALGLTSAANIGTAAPTFTFKAATNAFTTGEDLSTEDWSVSYEAKADGSMTFRLLDHNGKEKSIVTLTAKELADIGHGANATSTINFGKYGSLEINNTVGTAEIIVDTDNLPAGPVATTIAIASSLEDPLVAGETPVTTPEVKAAMVLSINGETVTLYKGDTYANFYNQGIAFDFNALSDADILDGAIFFGAATADISGADAIDIIVKETGGKSLVIQSGANQGDELSINIDQMNTETLGVAYSNISTRTAASTAISEVNGAINQVSTQRALLGALQNRLDHKIANLDTSAENLTAAESRIRDVDMAKEMTNFTKNNILLQASTAMLAQANAAPQGVLQLLG